MDFSGPMLTPRSCKKLFKDGLGLGSVCCMMDLSGMMAGSVLKYIGAGLGL